MGQEVVKELVRPTNSLLAARRRFFGKSQSDLRDALYELTEIRVSISRISDFEGGTKDEIANGVTRSHYEAVVEIWEREASEK